MPSAPSRFEVEHLHRLMMQASAEAARLERKLEEERRGDGLSAALGQWHDAAGAVHAALERAAPELRREGTPAGQLERIRGRLVDLEKRAQRFDLDEDLDDCVDHWRALGHELAQLSGAQRDPLVRLLEGRRARIDQVTSLLVEARGKGGLAPQKHASVRALQDQRDRAREKVERLRQTYLEADKDQKAAEHLQQKAPLPNPAALAAAARKNPAVVHLPAPAKPPAFRASGPLRVAVERVERVAGYVPGADGIGHGRQSAALWFRAENAPAALSIPGALVLQLGCGVRLEVVPAVQLLAGAGPGTLRGKLSFALVSSGGRLGVTARRAALDAARRSARAGARGVASGLGVLGRHLESALAGLLEDAAEKIFRRGSILHEVRQPGPSRIERTLSDLAVGGQRTLADPVAGEIRRHLARMDSVLARLRDKPRHEVAQGAAEIGTLLRRMNAVSAGAPHAAQLRKLIDERKGQLDAVFKAAPGMDRQLQQAAQAQLAAQLARTAEQGGLHQLAGKLARAAPAALTSMFQQPAAAQLARLGGQHAGALGSLSGLGGGLATALEKQRPATSREVARVLAGAPTGSPLHDLARKAEARQRQLASRQQRGPLPSQVTAAALLDVFRQHPAGKAFAAHLAPGGALRGLCEAAQRGHGLPIGQAAQHYLASRGHSAVFNAVATVNQLMRQGYKPHRWGLGSIGHFVSSQVSSAVQSVSNTVSSARSAMTGLASTAFSTARAGISSLGTQALSLGVGAFNRVNAVVQRGVGIARGVINTGSAVFHAATGAISNRAHALWNAGRGAAQVALGNIRHRAHALGNVVRGGVHAAQGAASWVQHKAGAAAQWAQHKSHGAAHWMGEKVHSGLEWTHKVGLVGGSALRKGVSFVRKAAGYTPLGLAVNAGRWAAGGGLARVWDKTRHLAGKAWHGIETVYAGASKFLQSPAGQLMVTGLSLAASFIPGGMVVKAVIGGGIGAIQAISEGKDWKGVLAGAAGGALAGALPFLKVGPLAKVGIGALSGGITAIAQGGSLKDALKGAAGGALDSFDPGAFKALSRLKGVTAAGKLLKGKNLSKAEKALMEGSKFAGPLRALEKAMLDPRTRRVVGGLEKAGGKAVKGGIWVSGKAARAQHVLDKVVGAGDKVHGVLTQVHELAPGLAEILGDNAAGHFVGEVGDWAGKGDDKLARALEYGHTASGELAKYRGYLDKGLGYAGVKNPAGAYEKMMARKELREGKKGGLEHVARLKLEEHRRRHPELHLSEATRKTARKKPAAQGKLELALARGRTLIHQGQQVARGVNAGLGKVQGVLEKGLAGAHKVQGGLEKAMELAKQGAGLAGEDTDLGKYLLHVSERAEHVHGYLEQRIGLAEDIEKGVARAHDWTGRIPGASQPEPLAEATHLEGKRRKRKRGEKDVPEAKVSPHDPPAHAPAKAPDPHESEEQRTRRLQQAWNLIGTISRHVQRYETRYARVQREIQEHLANGRGSKASLALIDLGTYCDQINGWIEQAKAAARGNHKYLEQIAFYEEWHAATKKKLHAAIADTKGLGSETAISGFGITEESHPDIFANTRDIYAVRTKVQAFGAALADPDAASHVKALLEEAKQARAGLSRLKTKYRKDKAATRFLTGGGEQDRLIDESIRKLAAALKGEGEKKPAPAKKEPPKKKAADLLQSVKGGLAAIDRFRKKAVKAGRKVDANLGKLEKALDKGLRAGKKADAGLEKIAGVAERLSAMLGDDSDLGHLAHQVGEASGKGHEKLHHALDLARKGKSGLREGRALFEEGLALAAGEHAKKAKQKASPHDLPAELVHLAGDGGHLVEHGKELFEDGRHVVGHVHGAVESVTRFGETVAAAMKEVEKLLREGKTKEAADRVQAVHAHSEATRAQVARAVSATENDAALHGRARSAGRHYLEVRRHFFGFVQGLHGLSGEVRKLARAQARPRAHGKASRAAPETTGHRPGAIHVNARGARRDGMDVHDGQGVDSAAMDTWVGSGEGANVFSQVFRELLPAEGAAALAQHGDGGFFQGLFEHLHGFADRIAGWARRGGGLLGKGRHFAEWGMHGLSAIEKGAEKVQALAGRAEGFLSRMGLGHLAAFAGRIGGAAGWVDTEARAFHGGLRTADRWMGKGKKLAGRVEGGANEAGALFDEAEHGRFGTLVSLFKASRGGDGIDGRLAPDKLRLGSHFDEPRRLDVTTLSRMETFLGGDFSRVRIHTGPGAAEVTQRFAAEAVTVKDHIFFAPGRFNPGTVEGQRLLAHELTHVLQKGRPNLDVRTAESEALRSEHSYSYGTPQMETLNLGRPQPGFRLADGEGLGSSSGVHTAKRNRSRGHDAGARDAQPDGEEFLEQVSGRVYDLLMEELEQAFESR